MAQYPQGIFQSLQYLLKRVKILALQKQPTYPSISTASAAYTLPGRGVYEITTASASNAIIFPDPLLCSGQIITVINTDAVTAQAVSSTNQPYSKGTNTQLSSFAATTYYRFVAINGKWRGGVIS